MTLIVCKHINKCLKALLYIKIINDCDDMS